MRNKNPKSGIYKISLKNCEKVYIGSSQDLHTRKTTHLWGLKNNKHYNKYLQRAYNKYGGFSFDILEITKDLLSKEQSWVNFYKSYDPQLGFNLVPLVQFGGTSGMVFKGKRKKNHLKMMEEKMWPARKKHFKFLNPEGEIVELFGLRQFCMNNNLCYKAMLNVHKEIINTCSGWRKYFEDGSIKKHKGKDFTLRTPQGEIIIINNLERFCRENKIWIRSLKKGWKSKGYKLIIN